MGSQLPIDLEASHVVANAKKLRDRITERFPGATLKKTAVRLVATAEATAARAESLARPNTALRLATMALILAIPVSIALAVYLVAPGRSGLRSLADFVAFFQSSLESLIFLGAGIAFLVTLESRLKRNRALRAIHELRVLAHLVDMHTLDKDPVYAMQGGPTTASSPKRGMTPFELNRYLDYCGEMLSLTGKIAAIYGQNLDDPVSLGAVDQVESITTGLSRKIWQKIMLLNRPIGGAEA